MNIFQKSKEGIITPEVEAISGYEDVPVSSLMDSFSKGEVAIFKNRNRDIKPVAVGKGLRTKVNANIGSSPDMFNIDIELEKLKTAVEYGADTVMDLSTGGNIRDFRKKILEESSVPLGTVPIYEVAVSMVSRKKSIIDMKIGDYLEIIKRQAEDGVDYMTIHSGVTMQSLESLRSQQRIIGITSRGGSMLSEWISRNKKENPLYEYYDEILDILADYNIVISLGDGLRPGCISDASDRGQVHEMIILGDLARRARERGVQAIIEGPGHVPLDMIADNMRLEKSLCDNAPYYVLGPLVTDIAPGYDHITSAIGGAIAAASGADFLCYVTPAEHLRLPTVEDVKEGVIASKIAAHAADLVKLRSKAIEWDNDMSRARKKRDWQEMFRLSIDKGKAEKYRSEIPSGKDDQCSMCGEFCAIKNKLDDNNL
ncbi:MAG: phosphomethylpyrimidine synthase ThiC [Spirochaetes bacterium]|nr:phosphomethylpyrimidine synthase ThiC [Spirochaetota bacterium]